MGCCFDTAPATLAPASLDPSKHVNYVLGMVLGEDDFKQEFAYLSGRDRWLARDLIGYGTARGLAVRVDIDGTNGPRIYVDAGVAVSPSGQMICVSAPQCAYVNDWLRNNAAEVMQRIGSPGQDLSLYVVLCYRDCPTDAVPIPGEPCRTEDQLTKPSRLQDDFCLELVLDPPQQREERAVRELCQWLRRVDMCDSSASSTPLDQFLDAIRGSVVTSPPASPPGPLQLGSPPHDLKINPADVVEYLRAAFRLWVTELRPQWIERWFGCGANATATPIEDCVLLGQITVPLVAAGAGVFEADDRTAPVVLEDERPFLIHLRMLQEWLLCAARSCGSVAGSPPMLGQNLNPAAAVVAETTFGNLPNVGTSPDYARADHTHGSPALNGDVTVLAGSTRVGRIQNVPVVATGAAAGQVLTFNGAQWQPSNLPAAQTPVLAGDIVGSANNNQLIRMLGKPLPGAATVFQSGQALAVNQTQNAWVPAAFVGRADATRGYSIVAAGRVQFAMVAGQTAPDPNSAATLIGGVGSGYNGFAVVAPGLYDAARGGFKFTFAGFQPTATYIVSITPWAPKASGRTNPFMAYFGDFDTAAAPFGFFVTITTNPNAGITAGQLMIEVSQIG